MSQQLRFDPADDDFGSMVVCAVRYSLGRCTYMSKLICDYLTPRLFLLDDKAIGCMERDIRASSFYGDDCDRQVWMEFLSAVENEMERRGIRTWR